MAFVPKPLLLTEEQIRDLDSTVVSGADKKAYIKWLRAPAPQVPTSWKDKLAISHRRLARWSGLLDGNASEAMPFSLSHSQMIRRARGSLPLGAKLTVSSFADWIYRLYVPEKNYSSMMIGLNLERLIAQQRIEAPSHDQWVLVHNGLGPDREAAFEIPALDVLGQSFWGSPDVVLREKRTGRVLIVEVKVTEAPIPHDAWPNTRAQLWAYSKVPAWIDAPEVILAAEIWGFHGAIRRRQVITWRASDPIFERENSEFFTIFKAQHERLQSWKARTGA